MTDRRKSNHFNLMMHVSDFVSEGALCVDFHRLLLIRKQKGALPFVFFGFGSRQCAIRFFERMKKIFFFAAYGCRFPFFPVYILPLAGFAAENGRCALVLSLPAGGGGVGIFFRAVFGAAAGSVRAAGIAGTILALCPAASSTTGSQGRTGSRAFGREAARRSGCEKV